MPSLINQMRNGMSMQAQQPQSQMNQQVSQQQIDAVRNLMLRCKAMQNPQAAITYLLQQNPQLGNIIPLLRNGNSLEGIARSMAQSKEIDINQLLSQLPGGIL